MRKNLFFILSSIILSTAFIACDKSDDNGKSAQEQAIGVRLPDNAVLGRSVQTPVDPAGSSAYTVLNDVTVFLMTDQTVVEYHRFEPDEITAKYKRLEQVPGNVNNVVVVANHRGHDVTAATTLNGVTKYPFTIAKQNDVAGIDGKTLMGSSAPQTTTDPNPHQDHYYKEAAITLDALTSRMEVGAVYAGEGVKSVELVAVYVNNYYANGSKDNVSLFPSTSNYWLTNYSDMKSGTPFGDVTFTYTYPESSYFDRADNVNVIRDPGSKCYAYHVFSGNLPHLILLVKGEYEDLYHEDDTDKYFLGWVTFNNYRDQNDNLITAMQPNRIYKMGVGSTGIRIDAKDIYEKPEMGKVDLGLKVTVAAWIDEIVTPEV